ncbi:extracellular calcium-sensing receptor-like [Rhinatrema bivittatum]|uniref:extracellular calcium-sensing receptor-like n=1 Tax=Rhinatrema bivittatum TaxID=194408 RepID=UPI00112B94ED|nr:extracellular calcium-sensing receptor-like [Rhinatrema bivittatum]
MALPALVLLLLPPSLLSPASTATGGCALPGQGELSNRREGDILIGALLPVHLNWREPKMTFAESPQPILCQSKISSQMITDIYQTRCNHPIYPATPQQRLGKTISSVQEEIDAKTFLQSCCITGQDHKQCTGVPSKDLHLGQFLSIVIPKCFAFNGEEDVLNDNNIYSEINALHNFSPMPPSFVISLFRFSLRIYSWAMAMIFTIEDINQDKTFLPNITLGFQLYDSCVSLMRALWGTVWMLTGKDRPVLNYQCQNQGLLSAIVGESWSTSSISMARLLGLYRYPQISYLSSSPLLSDKFQFPSFFRTLPSDVIQALGQAQLVTHLGWTWVGVLSTEDDYGTLGSQILKEELQKRGVCVAFHEKIPLVPSSVKINRIVEVVRRSSASVILVFSSEPFVLPVMQAFSRQNISGKVWIASESWSVTSGVITIELSNLLRGTIGFAFTEGKINGIQEFLHNFKPSSAPNDPLVLQSWEVIFRCQWPNPQTNLTTAEGKLEEATRFCTGAESLDKLMDSEVSSPRIGYSIYNAVYSVAHALRDMLSCVPGEGPFTNKTCANIRSHEPWQLLHYMRKVQFWNKMGEEMYFDINGNPPAAYDIINWHQQPDGAIQYVKVPHSLCTESCPPGYRKAAQKGQPLCCFDCLPCAEGEISNMTDSAICWLCPNDYWPNSRRNECSPKRIEFLSYQEPLGGTLTATASFSSITTVTVLCIFIKYGDTPIAKANNRAFSFLLLGALVMSFLCSLLFIGEPQPTTCLIRQTAFGVIFVLCVSCLLAKTIMVVIAFSATKPNSNLRGWLGLWLPIVIVSASTLIQVLICVTWLLLCPPFPEKNMKLKTGIIIWQCNECSDVAFWCMLGYMGFLACVSFLVAFLARKLPDSFNEAKWITFSMLVFLSVWMSFIPGYLSTQGKYMVAVEVFGIISSSAGILVCIFFPKCYIMVLRPEMNTREQLLGKMTRNRKIKAI